LSATREALKARLNTMQDELHAAWKQWDSGNSAATTQMVDVLNRRSYLRNLVRDINEALK
jgi:molecular chaperone HscB